MRDAGLVLAGMLLGWSAEGAWWRLQPQVSSAWRWSALRSKQGWRWLRGRKWREPRQWFKPSDRPQGAPPTVPRPQPGPRPVVGQRPSGGSHRAVQRTARFGTRTFRRRARQGG